MHFSKLFSIAILTMLLGLTTLAHADDTDLFNQTPGSVIAPNVLFILDNSANWNANDQAWGTNPNGTLMKQGDAEIKALATLADGITTPTNIGLMMYTASGYSGGYIRYGIRPMAPNATATSAQSANKTAFVTMLGGASVTSDSVNVASRIIPNAFYETWLYLKGAASWAGMDPKADYPGNTVYSQSLPSPFAYQSQVTQSLYNSPLGVACAKTYIVYIHNNKTKLTTPRSTDPSVTTLTPYGYPSTLDIHSAWTRFLRLRPDLGVGSAAATNAAVTTYTIDVYNDATSPNPSISTVLADMAQNGGGKYFQVKTANALQTAMKNILAQIQAVNSVFASASLPVSVSVRGTYLNQVYMGMFRPDPLSQPNWVGNLKQYELAANTLTTPPSVFLADSAGTPAENKITGFVDPSAISFWTIGSQFWDPSYYVKSQGAGGSSDSPDGDLVEKGGAAQYVRTTFATSQSARHLFTCTGNCSRGSLLSATPFATTNTDVMSSLGTTNATEQANIINWVRGGNLNQDDPTPLSSTDTNPAVAPTSIRGFAHGDVLHSRPAVINYNRNTDDIVIFYGANDGILHAVKGGQNITNGDGNEMWGFIASEHLTQFKRMRDHLPLISSTNPKPYFMDGSTTTYTHTAADGSIDQAYLFITMRRGGRFIYALDVSDPSNPKFLWKRSNADFPELGQSWSDMKVAKIRAQTNPVLIFGLGYDSAANDPMPQATATMGRGVIVLDALTGTQIWQAGPAPSGSTTLTVPGMIYAIPANVSLYDSNGDGYIDRIYAADTGANVWRFNIDDASPSNWTVSQLAALGGSSVDARKFLYPADIVPATSSNNFDSLLIGSGDREHPFDATINNRFYMIKDDHGLTATRATPIVEGAINSSTVTAGQLYDATADLVQVGTTAQQTAAATALATGSGWYVRLGSGEKVVSGSTTMAGTTIFGTNSPATTSTNSCVGNLGEARLYMLDYLNAGATLDVDQSGTLTLADRYQVRAGGGYPPTPVPVSVRIDGKTYQAAITGTQVITPPGPLLGRRYRTFWQRLID